MMNKIWASFIIIGITYSILTGNIELISSEIIKSAEASFNMIIKIFPVMALWLGIMKIATESGLLTKLSKILYPFMKKLFPEIPKNHESISLITSNVIMNMFGLGNAATPFGLKAIKEMQEFNDDKDVASRSMITFLIINTAAVTIMPTTIIGLRVLYGSVNALNIIPYVIITSFCSCLIGLIIDRLLYMVMK